MAGLGPLSSQKPMNKMQQLETSPAHLSPPSYSACLEAATTSPPTLPELMHCWKEYHPSNDTFKRIAQDVECSLMTDKERKVFQTVLAASEESPSPSSLPSAITTDQELCPLAMIRVKAILSPPQYQETTFCCSLVPSDPYMDYEDLEVHNKRSSVSSSDSVGDAGDGGARFENAKTKKFKTIKKFGWIAANILSVVIG